MRHRLRHLLAVPLLLAGTCAVVGATATIPAGAATQAVTHVAAARTADTAAPVRVLSVKDSDHAACTIPLYYGQEQFISPGYCLQQTEPCSVYDQGTIPLVTVYGLYPNYVWNGCGYRLWIYTGTGRSGYNVCISPRSETGYLFKQYVWYWESANADNC
jgi:hypothetical protein